MDISFDSNQPFVFQEKDKTLVFICNGEIYNFKQLITKYGLDINNNIAIVVQFLNFISSLKKKGD